jgi:hypothetical protein
MYISTILCYIDRPTLVVLLATIRSAAPEELPYMAPTQ